MKQSLKNEVDMLGLINNIQAQLAVLDKKLDTLINQSAPVKNSTTPIPVRSNDHNKTRAMHTAICADCQKECTIPFKPSGDRPVYCKDCFSRRKVINLSGIKVDNKFPDVAPVQTVSNKAIDIQKPPAKSKKKAVTVKKPLAKKRPVPKKK